MNRIAWAAISIIIVGASLGGETRSAEPRAVQQRTVCGSLGAFRAKLFRDWGEFPYAAALNSQGQAMHIFVNPNSRTWTMLLTTPSGTSCMITNGTDWTHVPPPIPERESMR